MNINNKNLGALLVGFSLILIFILAFVKINTDREGAFLCEIVSNDPALDMSQCPAHKTSTSWLILSSFGIGFLIFASGLYMIYMPGKIEKDKKTEFNDVDVSKLDESEKKVYNLLKDKQGSMYQSDLIRETGLSKVQMTRILDKMVSKQIIDRHRRGMTNIVVLK